MTQTSPPAFPPFPSLTAFAGMGTRELVYPPAQSLLHGVKSWLNHPYAMVAGQRLQRLDVHVPEQAQEPVPLVVYASGGSWRLVGKHHGPWQFLLREGYAVASIEYRLHEEAKFPVPVHDVNAAIRWLRANAANYGVDAARIAGFGSSAGGFLMAMAAVTQGREYFEGSVGEHTDESSALACVIDYHGPSDLAKLGEDSIAPHDLRQLHGTSMAPESTLLGHIPGEEAAGAAPSCVGDYTNRETPPFLLLHGDADTLIGLNQSRRLYQALQAAGVASEFHVLAGANHAGPEFDSPEAHRLALDFLKRRLAALR